MTDDLTERLRRSASSWWAEDGLLAEAADEIERLRAEVEQFILVQVIELDKRILLEGEIERLRKVLTKISQSKGEDWDCWWIAEQALEGDDR